MDFLNQREGGMVFYQAFITSPLRCTIMHYRNRKKMHEFEEIKTKL
jgi:hypothetical protein